MLVSCRHFILIFVVSFALLVSHHSYADSYDESGYGVGGSTSSGFSLMAPILGVAAVLVGGAIYALSGKNANSETATVLSPTPTTSSLKVTPPSITTPMLVGATQTLDYTLNNTSSTQSLDISSVSGFSGVITRNTSITNNCPVTLAASGSCVIELKASPTQSGQISQNLIIGNSSGTVYSNSPINIVSANTPSLALSYVNSTPVIYSFPGQAISGTVTLVNNGAVDVQINSIAGGTGAGVSLAITTSSCRSNNSNNSQIISANGGIYSCTFTGTAPTSATVPAMPTITGADIPLSFTYQAVSGGERIVLSTPIRVLLPTYNWFLSLPTNASGSNSVSITSINIVLQQNNAIYLGTKTQGLAVSYNNGVSWSIYTVANNLGSNNVQGIYISGSGSSSNIYAATNSGLSISNDNGLSWTNYSSTTAGFSSSRNVIGVTVSGGYIYAVTDSGVSIGTGAATALTWSTSLLSGLASGEKITGFCLSGSNIYLVTSSGNIYYGIAGSAITWAKLGSLSGNAIAANGVSVLNNYIYVAAASGLYWGKINDASIAWGTPYTGVNSPLISSNVQGIYISGNSIYAATDKGVSVGNFNSDGSITWNSGSYTNLASSNVQGVYVLGNNIYVATFPDSSTGQGGLSISANGGTNWNSYATANTVGFNALPSKVVNAVFMQNNTIYAGTTGGGLGISYDNGVSWASYTTSNQLVSNNIQGVFAAGSNIYVATDGGLSISNNSGLSWTSYNNATAGFSTNNNVLGVSVLASSSGNTCVYAATPKGLSIGTVAASGATITWSTTTLPTSDTIAGFYMSGGNIYLTATNGDIYVGAIGSNGNIQKFIAMTVEGSAPTNSNGIAIFQDATNTYAYSATSTGLYVGAVIVASGLTTITWGSSSYLPTSTVQGVYVFGSNIYAATTAGLYVGTINNDGTITFGQPYTNLASSNIKGVYVSGGNIYAATSGGLSISTNSGANWTKVVNANVLAGTSIAALNALSDPQSANVSIYAATSTAALSISPNNGNGWSPFATLSPLHSITDISVALAPNAASSVPYIEILITGNSSVDGASYAVGISNFGYFTLPSDNSPCTNICLERILVQWGLSAKGIYVLPNSTGSDFLSYFGSSNTDLFGLCEVFSRNSMYRTCYCAVPNFGVTPICKDKTTNFGGDVVNEIFVSNAGSNIYAATSPITNYGGGGLSVSLNSGSNWTTYTSSANGFASNTVNGVFAAGPSWQYIYAATDSGLSVSSDTGTTWKKYLSGSNLSQVFATNTGANIYVLDSSNKLSVSSNSGAGWSAYTVAQGLPSNTINDIFGFTPTATSGLAPAYFYVGTTNGMAYTQVSQ